MRRVLIVAISVNNDVGALEQRVINARSKRSTKPAPIHTPGPNDMTNSERPRYLYRSIVRTIIDNLILNLINALDTFGHALEDKR
jgi:hypothetical protein